jgi:phage repressor protein C with HTH and peptisase S24 domain
MADIAGVSPPAVGYWLSDTYGIGADPARKLAAFFDVDPIWLEKGEGAPNGAPTSESNDNVPSGDEFALIPELDVRAACGPGGKFHDHVVVTGGLVFKRTFLGEMGVNEQHARVIHADGPSMEPTIGHGRVVLVNTADNTPQDGRVFLICDEDGGMLLKRLVREYEPTIGTTAWKIRSDNPDKRKYPDKFWPEDARACIVGRAIWHDGLL